MQVSLFVIIVAIIIFLVACKVFYDVGKEEGFQEGRRTAKRDIQKHYKCSECVECTMNQNGWSCKKGHFTDQGIEHVVNYMCGDIAVKLSNL